MVTGMDILTECERLRAELQTANDERYKAEYPGSNHFDAVTLIRGPKWHKLNIGSSGAYMVNAITGQVHGIKGYGTAHPKVIHGRVDQITGAQLLPRRWARAGVAPITA